MCARGGCALLRADFFDMKRQLCNLVPDIRTAQPRGERRHTAFFSYVLESKYEARARRPCPSEFFFFVVMFLRAPRPEARKRKSGMVPTLPRL